MTNANKNTNHKEIRILYGDSVTVLPITAADAVLRASGLDCKILLYLASDPAYRKGTKEAFSALAERVSCEVSDVERAIAYFRGAGVLDYEAVPVSQKKGGRPRKQSPEEIVEAELKTRREAQEQESAESSVEKPEKKLQRADELPNYTIEELGTLLESRKNLSLFLDECQRAYGKMFNPRDVGKVIGMLDYLSLKEEYILVLLRYFGEMPEEERKSLHYIERMAISLVNEGITDTEALEQHLDRLRLLRDSETQIRSIFGMGARAFTAKEKKAIMLWLGEYRVSMELIRLAYERTVNATGKPSVMYASKILERWHAEGLKTPADVEASETKESSESGDGNFETNDFFEAALRRSYGEAYEDIYRKKDSSGQ